MLGLALSNRYLIAQLVKRELALKYTGSVLGGLWVVVTPLIMLAIYSLFFTVVIKAKWGGAGFESDAFALLLFAGLLLHSFFAEILTSAPQLVVSNPNYVKKAVFPVEVFAIVQTLTAALGLTVNLTLLLLFVTIFQGLPGPEALFSIVILVPLLLMALGTAWLLSAMGVFFRDISQMTGLLAAALLFASPIFYPVSALSERAQGFLYLNPLTFLIEQLRLVVFAGVLPNFTGLGLFFMGAALFSYLSYRLFIRVKVGFADVL
ncbi:ABC transporter permease [Candidatus Marimicrobium litorale]|uniref:Transport permease protein n=1 Tax=Candidatus Marimicrobium litorale TaxID=2518991 RepID=A0ABT3T5I9_9GAMM|nr:ABC transporter permease [Candidatus Marimicrobium litorale]MCX2977545.1 ABC transporter permease [Candidatus Marimicrobium litorale]